MDFKFLRWIAAPILAFSLVACDAEDAKDNSITLQQQWFPTSGFSGELWAQEYLAKERGVKFKVVPGGGNIVTTQVVVSGQADFGVAGADQIMLANENGANLVVVGVINYRTLAGFISNIDKRITLPSDFIGKRIGTMEGTPVDFAYRVLMNESDVALDSLTEVPTNWTLVGFDKDYDVFPAFVNDEPISLQRERPGLKLSIIKPHDFGVYFIGTVYFARQELVENNPEKVQMFVNLMIDGWKAALKDPSKAIRVLKDFSKDIDDEKELKSMLAGLDYYRGENSKTLYASEKRWRKMFQQLKSAGLVSSFDYNSTVNSSFVNWYHTHAKD